MEKEELLRQLLEIVGNYDSKSIQVIYKAYEYANQVHGNQRRKSGEYYIIHPLHVAMILAELQADQDSICAALLHDVIEDGEITKEDLLKEFNRNIACLVDGVTKMKRELFPDKKSQNAANVRKFLREVMRDPRIIMIKLADRLHNMRTLMYLPRNKQIENAIETLEIFVPLAERVELRQMKNELEDLALWYLNADIYRVIQEKRQDIVRENTLFLDEMTNFVQECLQQEKIDNQVSYRIKSVYAICQRLFNHAIKPSELPGLKVKDIYFPDRLERQIHDIRSLKILVSNLEECYVSNDVIKSQFFIIPGKEKDCIQHPKTNGYQSLHTTVYGEDGLPVQTQIRTFQMEEFALYGLASYWKTFGDQASGQMLEKIQSDFPFYKSLMELDHVLTSDEEFVHQAKEEVLSNMIYPHTKEGKVVELPFGATPVDFAFQAFSNIGEFGMLAVVNGKYVPLNYQLSSKDTVEIIPILNCRWMDSLASYAVTTCAKKKIRNREMRA